MRYRTMAKVSVMALALGFPALLAAQEPTFEQRQAMDSVAVFLAEHGRRSDSEWVTREFMAKRIYFVANADSGIDRQDRVFVNATYAEQLRLRDPATQFRSTADLAATLLHERIHLGQSHFSQGESRARNIAGGDHPSEVEAWRGGFEAYRDFIAGESKVLQSATSEHDRERATIRVRELLRAFERYRSEYERPGNHFGEMRFADGQSLAEASADYARRAAELDKLLVHADFTTTLSPYRIVRKQGEDFTLTAATLGGAFNETRQKGQSQLYTYHWFADGVRFAGDGATIRRRATRTEVVTAVAVDRLGAKSSEGRCQVVVETTPAAVQAPTVAPPKVEPATGGRWVRVRTERVDSVLDKARVRSHTFSDGSYSAEVQYPRQAEPTSEKGAWTAPPGTLVPGTELPLTVSGAVSITVQVTRGLPQTEAVSTEDRPGVWKVTRGSGADQVFITAKAGGRYVMCTIVNVYEWKP